MSAANDEPWIGKVYRASRSAKFWVTTLVLAPGLFVAIYMLGAFVTNLDRVMALGWSIIRGLPVAAFVLLLVSGRIRGLRHSYLADEIGDPKPKASHSVVFLAYAFHTQFRSTLNPRESNTQRSANRSSRRHTPRKNGRCLARLAGYFDDFDEIVAWARHTFRADQSIW